MRRIRILLVVGAALATAGAIFAPWARAGGGMDPGYHEVLDEPERAVGRVVDWTVKIVSVEKSFYTYTLKALYVPDHGAEACGKCPMTITFRGRPEENARPSRFKANQLIRIRGTVLKLTPRPRVLAFVVKG